jgi:RNA polymerase sigma factor (sigma-70 family)
MKVVKDTVYDYWRRRRVAEDLACIDERFVSEVPTFEADLDLRRRIALLRRALELLDPQKRVLIDLFYAHDLSISAIAAIQKKSVSAVKMELSRSRRALAEIVRRLTNKKMR